MNCNGQLDNVVMFEYNNQLKKLVATDLKCTDNSLFYKLKT